MKTFVFFFFLTIPLVVFSQESRYEKAMKEQLLALDTTSSNEGLTRIAMAFERIARADTSQWLPAYYAAYVNVVVSFNENDPVRKDAILDKAEEMLNVSKSRKPDESENAVVEAFLYLARIQAYPMERGMEYSLRANAALDRAISLNPDNPRAYYLKGTTIYYTPEQFGGGKENAMPYLLKAREKFSHFSAPSAFWPLWGKEHLETILNSQ
ncbi:MAG: hypothetical protein GYA22_12035 [Bacteroidales bacterium]|nr:hypothetical protein [Bacteroidales bacterium]